MANFSIQIQQDQINPYLRRLSDRCLDLSEPMADIARLLRNLAEDSFQAERSPFGPAWEPLTEAYVNRPRRTRGGRPGGRGGDAHPILQRDGLLAAGISSGSDQRSAWLGADREYAAIHQFGGRAGMPAGPAGIPERPFLPVTTSGQLAPIAEAGILALLRRRLEP